MAFSKALAAGAATREGKVMTVAGLAGLGAFGCVSQAQFVPTCHDLQQIAHNAVVQCSAQLVGPGYGWSHRIL